MAIQGLDQLKRKLAALPQQTRRDLREALDKGADELVALQKNLVPIDSGDLRDSIRKEAGNHDLQVRVVAGGETTTKPVREGQEQSFDYALGVEFGTSDAEAQPFFFPAYRALRRRIRSRISRATRKAAQRVAGGGQ